MEKKGNERLKFDPRYLQFEEDTNMDQVLEEKYKCIDPDLDAVVSEYDAFNPKLEGQIDIFFEKEAKLRAKKKGSKKQETKPAPKGLDVKVILRNKAIKDKDFALYEKIQVITDAQAVARL